MYKCEESGLMQYETFEEILNAKITGAAEDNDNYYIGIKYDDQYHNTVWVVDKKTKRVSQITLIDYLLDIADKTTRVDIDSLRKVS